MSGAAWSMSARHCFAPLGDIGGLLNVTDLEKRWDKNDALSPRGSHS